MADHPEAADRSNAFLREQISERLRAFEAYCIATRDDRARAWLFHEGPPSPALQGHAVIERPASPLRIHILDLYHGRAPTLINLRTLTRGPNVQIALRLFVILDSNALSYLRQFFSGGLDSEGEAVIRSFLAFIFDRGIDPSAVFYLLESLARAEPSRWSEQAASFAATLADIQTLDQHLLLSQGVVASSLEARERQLIHHGVPDSARLVDKYTGSISREVAIAEGTQISRTYAALLKAMLVRTSGAPLSAKMSELGDFMISRLGAVLGLERFAALLHWAAPEQFARMLTPIQRGARADKVLGKAQSTAWDIYLGRLPEQLGRFLPLTEPAEAEGTCNLFYIATAENALARLIGHRTIELLVQHVDYERSSIVVGHHAGMLESLLSLEQLSEISDASLKWERRAKETAHLRTPVAGADLEQVIDELENEVRAVCTA